MKRSRFAMRTAVAALAAFGTPAACPISAEVPAVADETGHCSRTARHQLRIVLDVGHSPDSPGATSARGIPEYRFNRRLAERAKDALAHAAFDDVLIVGASRKTSTLPDRVAEANRLDPDVFVSLHHDSVHASYLQTWTYQGEDHLYADRFRGYSLFVSYQNAYRADSVKLARALGHALRARGLTFTRHHAEPIKGENRQLVGPRTGIYRYDHLFVLRHVDAPAVVFEAGVIVNREEEVMLASEAYRTTLAEALVTGIEAYCGYLLGRPEL